MTGQVEGRPSGVVFGGGGLRERFRAREDRAIPECSADASDLTTRRADAGRSWFVPTTWPLIGSVARLVERSSARGLVGRRRGQSQHGGVVCGGRRDHVGGWPEPGGDERHECGQSGQRCCGHEAVVVAADQSSGVRCARANLVVMWLADRVLATASPSEPPIW